MREFDINKMNDCSLIGLFDPSVASHNEKGWRLINDICVNHCAGERTEEIGMILDEMYNRTIREQPKRVMNETIL